MDAFTAALAGRVPENALLSHDLIEGIFARAGLVTDVELFEEFPTDYEVAAARQHRWARGDWQLLPWILKGAAPTRSSRPGSLSIGRWKMLDNLRRTLSAPAAWLTLVAGWTLPHGRAARVDGLRARHHRAARPAVPARRPDPRRARESPSGRTCAPSGRASPSPAPRSRLGVTFLAHQAWLMSDAIGRTLGRLYLTRRRLLEWTTAAQAKSDMSREITGVYRRMRGAPILAVAGGALVALARPDSAVVAAPFLVLWGLSPLVARWVSRPPRLSPTPQPSPADARTLRSTARRTWRFFEAFVGPADHDLPPDNFQEDPKPVVAHRTSPTNIGLYLLSTVAARDFGWLGSLDMLARLEATLADDGAPRALPGPLLQLVRHGRPPPARAPLRVDRGQREPRRPSARPRQRLRERDPPSAARSRRLRRHRGRARARRGGRERPRATADPPRRSRSASSTRAAQALAAALREPPTSPAAWAARLRQLAGLADTLVDIARTLTAERGDGEHADLLAWAEATRAAIASHERDRADAHALGTPPRGRAVPVRHRTSGGHQGHRGLAVVIARPGRAGRPRRGRRPPSSPRCAMRACASVRRTATTPRSSTRPSRRSRRPPSRARGSSIASRP